jgi:hypothetical protein
MVNFAIPKPRVFYSDQRNTDIYGTKPDKRQLEKDRDFFVDAPTDVQSIIANRSRTHSLALPCASMNPS